MSGIVDDISEVTGIVAVEKATDNVYNYMHPYNFYAQASELNIITRTKDGCGDILAYLPYIKLYDALKKTKPKVLLRKYTLVSIFTYIVNPEMKSWTDDQKKEILEKSKLDTCLMINYDKLFKFLQTYKPRAKDELDEINGVLKSKKITLVGGETHSTLLRTSRPLNMTKNKQLVTKKNRRTRRRKSRKVH